MLSAALGLSRSGDAADAAFAAARVARGRLGSRAGIAFLFASGRVALDPELPGVVSRALEGTPLVGASGVGIVTSEGEVTAQDAVAVLLLSREAGARIAVQVEAEKNPAAAAREAARELSPHAKPGALAVVLADPTAFDEKVVLAGLREGLAPAVIVGGGASGVGGRPVVYSGPRALRGGLAVALLDPPATPAVDVTLACSLVGGAMKITRCEANVVYELDGERAFDRYMAAAAATAQLDLRHAAGFLFVALPGDAGFARGNFRVRPVLGADPKTGALAMSEAVTEGGELAFALREAMAAQRDLKTMLTDQRARLAGRPPAAGLYFNCAGRGASLYGAESVDALTISRELGAFPFAGLASSFELAPAPRGMLMYTGVLAVLPA